VPLTDLSTATVQALEEVLDPELPAVNPLDAWSRGGEHAVERMARSLSIMMQDPGTAIGAVVHDRAPGGAVYRHYLHYMQAARAAAGKPVALVAARQGSGCDRQVVEWTHAGYPVLDGIPMFLRGIRALFACRDHFAHPAGTPPSPPVDAVERWRHELRVAATLDEAASLSMLQDFGIPVIGCRSASDIQSLEAAAAAMTFPVVLKTATPGILHKTEHRGVILDIANAVELRAAYSELSIRLGAEVLVAPMMKGGLEMILGARHDPQFGPVVLLGFGGIHAEVLQDVAFAIPPFDRYAARRNIDKLRMRPLLDGKRGKPAFDVNGFCDVAALFSAMVHALRNELQEVDVNPLMVTADGCAAVDALAVSRSGNAKR
jgi:acyl-CoA synthetase (NDP forming)